MYKLHFDNFLINEHDDDDDGTGTGTSVLSTRHKTL